MVVLTNRLGLPEPIARAVANDGYTRGDADISVTTLIGPARKRVLEQRHAHEITEDVADRIWALLGQIAHGILERADIEGWNEQRLFITRHGWTISGQFDRVLVAAGALGDYKLTSTYSVKDGLKPDHEAQANIYRLMLQEHGVEISSAQVVYILRDWQRSKAKNDLGYPQLPVLVADVPLWPVEQVEAYITQRLAAHGHAQHTLPDCTDAERWSRPAKWAVMKRGNVRAVRLHDTQQDADAHAAALQSEAKKRVEYFVEHRPGEHVRCADFCAVADFCEQWQAIKPAPSRSLKL